MRLLLTQLLCGLLFWVALIPTSFAAKTTEIVLWHSYRAKEKRALDLVVQRYNQSQKKIRLKVLKIPYDAYADKISAAIPRGNGPDIFIFANDRIGDWAKNKILEKITFWVDRQLLSRFFPKTVRMLAYKRNLYGLPLAYKSLALFYNKALVKTPPTTSAALVKLAKQLTNHKKGQFGLAYEATNFYFHVPWLHGFGARVFDKAGKLGVASAASVKALTFARDLLLVHKVLPAEPTSNLVSSLFNQGKAAMVINGPWFRGEINKSISYGVAPLPVISGVNKPAAPFLTSEAVLLSRYSKHKAIAFKVMKYLTSQASAMLRLKVGQQPVANKACYTTKYAKNDPILQAFYKQMQQAIPMPNTPEMRVVWTPMLNALGQVFRGQSTPKAALEAAQKEILSFLQPKKK